MHYGYRIVEDMIDGLSQLDGRKGLRQPRRFPWPRLAARDGLETPRFELPIIAAFIPRNALDATSAILRAEMARTSASTATVTRSPEAAQAATRARITVTPIAKLDSRTAPDGKTPPERIPHVDEDQCVGCNLCWLVCPAPGSITMGRLKPDGRSSPGSRGIG